MIHRDLHVAKEVYDMISVGLTVHSQKLKQKVLLIELIHLELMECLSNIDWLKLLQQRQENLSPYGFVR